MPKIKNPKKVAAFAKRKMGDIKDAVKKAGIDMREKIRRIEDEITNFLREYVHEKVIGILTDALDACLQVRNIWNN